MMIWHRLLTILFCGVAFMGHANILPHSIIRINNPLIKTVQWRVNNRPVTIPVTDLHGRNNLTLHFDLLQPVDEGDEYMPWLQARFRHVDADWRDDRLATPEYIDGFNIFDIGYGVPSIGGLTNLYRHFSFIINPYIFKLKLSGNYLIEIFEASSPDSIFLSVPVMIEEQSAAIDATASTITDIDYKNAHQQIDIDVSNLNIDESIRPHDWKLVIDQNGNAITKRKLEFPSEVTHKGARYHHRKELIFPGANQYRRMEFTDMEKPSLHVDQIVWIDPYYHIILGEDYFRGYLNYKSTFDNNGTFTIREYNSDESDIEADYGIVHFTLSGENIPLDTQIYIEGDLTSRNLSDENLMEYDSRTNTYHKSLFLKQGAYDYQYIVVPAENEDNIFMIEGNHHETASQYNIFLYYRIPGERTDRLAVYENIKPY